jgi:hypothetical protein
MSTKKEGGVKLVAQTRGDFREISSTIVLSGH